MVMLQRDGGRGTGDGGGVTHHLMVLLRLGWLTVLSSMKIVEQELYFFVRSPGDICVRDREDV